MNKGKITASYIYSISFQFKQKNKRKTNKLIQQKIKETKSK